MAGNERAPERRQRATIVDVARASGVSKSTVANVINGTVPLSDQTRDRVLAAIETLGYRRNVLARDLKRRRSTTLGVIVGDLANPFFAELTKRIEQQASRAGYATIICDTDGSPATESEKLGVLLEQRVAGILMLYFSGDEQRIAEVEHDGVPIGGVSVIDRALPCVASDDAKGARLAVEHLAQLGHERIAYVPSVGTETSTNVARKRGWREALKRAGLPRGPVVTLASSAGRRLATLDDTLAGPGRPTAYFAGTDLTALELMDRLEAAGLDVPADASVVGFDDIPVAGLRRIALTTLRQPIADLAELGVSRLLERVDAPPTDDPAPREHKRLTPELIVRGTTASPG